MRASDYIVTYEHVTVAPEQQGRIEHQSINDAIVRIGAHGRQPQTARHCRLIERAAQLDAILVDEIQQNRGTVGQREFVVAQCRHGVLR